MPALPTERPTFWETSLLQVRKKPDLTRTRTIITYNLILAWLRNFAFFETRASNQDREYACRVYHSASTVCSCLYMYHSSCFREISRWVTHTGTVAALTCFFLSFFLSFFFFSSSKTILSWSQVNRVFVIPLWYLHPSRRFPLLWLPWYFIKKLHCTIETRSPIGQITLALALR